MRIDSMNTNNEENKPVEIVIAYYNSLAFFELLPHFTSKIKLYDKSTSIDNSLEILDIQLKYPNIERISKENIGREGETYLSHIIDNYDSLAEYTIFIQDDTDNHITNLRYFLQSTQKCLQDKYLFMPYPCSWKKGGNPYRRTIVNGISDLHTFPSPYAIHDTTRRFQLHLPQVYQTDICAFFIVKKDKIHERPITFYQELREWLLSDDANGFVLEHIWKLIFA